MTKPKVARPPAKQVKQLPSQPQPTSVAPKAFTLKAENLNEIVQCINEVVPNKYSKQVIFTALNANLVPAKEIK